MTTKPLPDKFTLTREDNIFLAKKYLKDSVYRSAFLEGIAVTFPQTEAILENAQVHDVSSRDISKVFGLRDGWRYILDHLDQPVNLQFLEDLHQIVAREDVPWHFLGTLRTSSVRISGTHYLPPLPNAEKLHQYLLNIDHLLPPPPKTPSQTSPEPLHAPSATDLAIELMLYIMRAQPFLDGNKRVATLTCNKILISTGHGIFSLPPELKEDFTTELVKYYESGNSTTLKSLIFTHCLTGLD